MIYIVAMKKHRRPSCISSQIRLNKMKHKAIWLHGNNCLKCGSDNKIEMDHIKPVSFYPELVHKFFNVQILCKPCNIKKSNKIEDDHDYRLDRNKIENMSSSDLSILENMYIKHLSKYPVKDNKYLKSLMKIKRLKKAI